MCIFAPTKILRDGAEVARWAHNPKVVGSNPAPATKKDKKNRPHERFFLCLLSALGTKISLRFQRVTVVSVLLLSPL